MSEGLPIDPKAATEAVAKAFSAVLGKPASWVSQLISQELARFQLERLAELADKLRPLIAKYPGVLDAPEYKFLIPFFQSASLDDDPELQEMWARLFVEESAAPRSEHRIFIDVLKSLSGADARFFRDRLNLMHGRPYTGHPYESWSLGIREHMQTYALQYLFAGRDFPADKRMKETAEQQRLFEAAAPESGVLLLWYTVNFGSGPVGKGMNYYIYPEGYRDWMSSVRNLQFLNLVTVRELEAENALAKRVSLSWIEISPFGVAFAKAVGMLDKPELRDAASAQSRS